MSRRLAREAALRSLFQVELGHSRPTEALEFNVKELGLTEPATDFANVLVHGAIEHLNEIDSVIGELTVGWSLQRLSRTDRAVLRIAIFELLHMQDGKPVPVVINEAVELAKAYGDESSARFVNGLLAKLAKEALKGEQ